jgi:phage antirepressor YoqD-like protein
MADLRGAVADAKGLVEGFDGIDADVRQVLENVAEIDKWELRRLLREEGILIRVREREVVPTP